MAKENDVKVSLVTVKIGETEITLTTKQARSLHKELSKLFGLGNDAPADVHHYHNYHNNYPSYPTVTWGNTAQTIYSATSEMDEVRCDLEIAIE